ncbi:2-hydroxyacid dehydrogenase [Ramlibacter sp. USB13]|uniref:2-hydroxyacid dehydrogenase n=1 Tax=Ramlibacter cellulosilyticus TaxID=2764187 RepID=A0A923MTG3_9BURK|nr:2-hydroxyacid dehydrogenase [Ramlibacter cellulosilyticus]MBC5783859.1 2-hydroxyacid dehydrogenase [Ramlibacter cellulosilyticus]
MQQRPVLLQVLPLLPALERGLAESYTVHRLPPAGTEREAFLAQRGKEIEGVVTSAQGGASSALLSALPNVRVISSFGVGLDQLDLATAARRNIPVGYTPDVLNDCVADMAFSLVLASGRRIPEADRFVRAGRWARKEAFPLGRQVSGARLGIVGLGRIGRTIAKRASGFDMDVRYHSRRPVEGVAWTYEPQLLELARWADFLVVITAGGAETRHLIDASVLDALGPQGFLVNVSRGTVVDEAALVRALQEKRIAGAGLDVFEDEPNVPQELFALDNVVLAPHISSSTAQTRQAMAQRVLDNLAAFFAGREMPSRASAG